MVALLVSHIELHTPAKVADVLAFYADALGAKAAGPTDDSSTVAINVGVTQLRLHCRNEGPSNEAASLLAEVMGATSSVSADSTGAELQPFAGHIEVWTTERLRDVALRMAAITGDDGPELHEDEENDPRVVCVCPWGHKLLVREAPDNFTTRGCLQPMGTLGAVSRLVMGVRRGHAASIRSFFVSVLGSACELRHAGNPASGVSISFAVAPLCSGQQIIFEERDDERCVPLVEHPDGRVAPRTTQLAIYIQSREAFRVCFLAITAAHLLIEPATTTWEGAEASSCFKAHLQAPRTSVRAAQGDDGESGAVQTGIELELRSITHPSCPQGTGRRCGAGRMMGGFGAPARELATKARLSDSSQASSRESAASAANRRAGHRGESPGASRRLARPPQAPKSPGGGAPLPKSPGGAVRGSGLQQRPPTVPSGGSGRAMSPAGTRKDARPASPRRSPKADKGRSSPASPMRPDQQSMVHRQHL